MPPVVDTSRPAVGNPTGTVTRGQHDRGAVSRPAPATRLAGAGAWPTAVMDAEDARDRWFNDIEGGFNHSASGGRCEETTGRVAD